MQNHIHHTHYVGKRCFFKTIEGIALNTFENADEATAWGIELESMALLGEHIVLSGTYSYNQTEYDEFLSKDATACGLGPLAQGRGQDPLCQEDLNLAGNSFPLTPEHKLSFNATYNWQWQSLDWAVSGSYQYTSDQYMSAFNVDAYDSVDSWERWDARLSVASSEGRWQLAGYVKNLSDERTVVLRARPSTVTQNATSDLTEPRIYGVRLDYHF